MISEKTKPRDPDVTTTACRVRSTLRTARLRPAKGPQSTADPTEFGIVIRSLCLRSTHRGKHGGRYGQEAVPLQLTPAVLATVGLVL